MDTYETLAISFSGGVARVTIDNPPVNLFDAALLADLDRFVDAIAGDDGVRVIVFAGADPEFFVAHGDMATAADFDAFLGSPEDPGGDHSVNPMMRLHERVRALPQVTIAEVRGLARGGGAEFLSAMDMRFASVERAGFALMECGLGIIPGAGGTAYLPRLVGRARALEIMLGGELIDAVTAERLGWVNRAVPDSELGDVVDTFARRIARMPPGVAAAVKEAVDAAAESIGDGLRRADELLAALITRPAAARFAEAALAAGAQTREGERDLEAVIDRVIGA